MKKIKFDWQWLLFVLAIGLLALVPPNYNFFKTHFNFNGNTFTIIVTISSIISLTCAFFFCLWIIKQKNIVSGLITLCSIIGIFPVLFILPKKEATLNILIAQILIILILFIGSFTFFRIAYLIKTIGHQNKKKFLKPCVGIGVGYLIIGLYFLISMIF